MGLETTGETISTLITSNPTADDPRHQGDDHLRLIKSVLRTQFPGSAGDGYAVVITAVEAELNALSGLNTDESLETRLQTIENDLATGLADLAGELSAPVGTRMVFHQPTPPLGWVQDETSEINDSMLRIVSGVGAGGGSGGTDSAILMDKVPSHTHTIVESGDHLHEYTALFQTGGSGEVPGGGGALWSTGNTETAGAHTHEAAVNDPAANWTPKYLDTIIAERTD